MANQASHAKSRRVEGAQHMPIETLNELLRMDTTLAIGSNMSGSGEDRIQSTWADTLRSIPNSERSTGREVKRNSRTVIN